MYTGRRGNTVYEVLRKYIWLYLNFLMSRLVQEGGFLVFFFLSMRQGFMYPASASHAQDPRGEPPSRLGDPLGELHTRLETPVILKCGNLRSAFTKKLNVQGKEQHPAYTGYTGPHSQLAHGLSLSLTSLFALFAVQCDIMLIVLNGLQPLPKANKLLYPVGNGLV